MRIRSIIATGAIAFSAFTAGAAMHSAPQYYNPLAHTCNTEDSNNCRWDGSKQGNGVGKSYIVTRNGNVFYFDPAMSEHPAKPFSGIKR